MCGIKDLISGTHTQTRTNQTTHYRFFSNFYYNTGIYQIIQNAVISGIKCANTNSTPVWPSLYQNPQSPTITLMALCRYKQIYFLLFVTTQKQLD